MPQEERKHWSVVNWKGQIFGQTESSTMQFRTIEEQEDKSMFSNFECDDMWKDVKRQDKQSQLNEIAAFLAWPIDRFISNQSHSKYAIGIPQTLVAVASTDRAKTMRPPTPLLGLFN